MTAEVLECTQIEFLSKQVQTIVTGRQNDAQTIEVLRICGNLVLQATLPSLAKEASVVASA